MRRTIFEATRRTIHDIRIFFQVKFSWTNLATILALFPTASFSLGCACHRSGHNCKKFTLILHLSFYYLPENRNHFHLHIFPKGKVPGFWFFPCDKFCLWSLCIFGKMCLWFLFVIKEFFTRSQLPFSHFGLIFFEALFITNKKEHKKIVPVAITWSRPAPFCWLTIGACLPMCWPPKPWVNSWGGGPNLLGTGLGLGDMISKGVALWTLRVSGV